MTATAPLTDDKKKKDQGIVGQPGQQSQQVGQPVPLLPNDQNTTPAPLDDGKTDVKPVKYDVNKETDTVAGQLNSLTAQDSPYIQQAREGAKRQANSRGLINSSIAAGSGEAAAINAALPIAQQDASTYSDQRLQNQQAENTFLENRQNTDLNKELADFNNQLDMQNQEFSENLKRESDLILNDAKFNDEIKLQYVQQINQIMRDTQQQITDIGLSDRTAAQQAEAIRLAEQNRDAMIAVYQSLLGQSTDWDWGTDFTPDNQPTPGTVPNPGAQPTPQPPPTQPPPTQPPPTQPGQPGQPPGGAIPEPETRPNISIGAKWDPQLGLYKMDNAFGGSYWDKYGNRVNQDGSKFG